MKRIIFASLTALFAVVACQKVPITGRNQLMLINSKELLPMSFSSYREVLDSSKVLRNGAQVDMVKRAGQRIKKSVEDYLRANNYSQAIEGFQWEFNVIENKTINAWCMPGGKVVFYTGILPLCQDETGVAVVMGHEISHAIASHGAERMSQGLLAQGALAAGQVGLGAAMSNKPRETQATWMGLYGLAAPAAASVGYILPNSRNQESEADRLGLTFMAMAGYDPRAAVDFWQRMADASNGQKPPQWLSTHPADNTRIRDLKKLMPDAVAIYNKNRGRN
ncbi:M48 family metallopeptidase [Runella sp. MFBS21]|uniref:M48 family metallopeptidase n=1 Tax=Runella sp. MFBS21 TaxID=3034018 RepID=UPI0023F9027C|nr:M48 family metallopeptidase [Runella sp. MFBS21]MDF7819030.1 M48 family metallopeptidase [Runella sp. MFBS21]